MAKPKPENPQIVLYQTENGTSRIQVRLEDETVWLSQAQLVELFQTTKQNISLHIRNIFAEGELTPEATVKECLTVQSEGVRDVQQLIAFYNLDMIIAVGYRVSSHRGTQFRRTTHLMPLVCIPKRLPRTWQMMKRSKSWKRRNGRYRNRGSALVE